MAKMNGGGERKESRWFNLRCCLGASEMTLRLPRPSGRQPHCPDGIIHRHRADAMNSRLPFSLFFVLPKYLSAALRVVRHRQAKDHDVFVCFCIFFLCMMVCHCCVCVCFLSA